MGMKMDSETARAIIDGINDWEIQSIKPSSKLANAWSVTIGSTPRIVGDLLPGYVEGDEDGSIFPIEARDGTAEFDETVRLRRDPGKSGEGDEPGIVIWGTLTCAYESRDLGTFEGTIGFYEDEVEGAMLMTVASTTTSRTIVVRSLDEIDRGIKQLEGHGGHVIDHTGRILTQMSRLTSILSDGIAAGKAAE